MKKYSIKLLFFLLPVFILFIGAELYIRNSPNAFITKSEYLKQNKDKIETLFLGESYTQNGINPKYIKGNSCNLAYGSQDIQIDSALFFSNVKKMKSLKKVVFDLSYPRMDIENEKDYFRFPWYYIFYGVEINDLNFVNKYSVYLSSPNFFNAIIVNELKGNSKPLVINKYGFVEKNYTNEFVLSNYDSLKITSSAKERLKNRHKEISNKIFERNENRIESIIKYCKSNNIEFYLVTPPYYYTFRENEIPEKREKVRNYINYLTKNYAVEYYDFESNDKFYLNDFSNDDHLNANGAEKYSKLLDAKINNQ
jgi:hypothetical protein